MNETRSEKDVDIDQDIDPEIKPPYMYRVILLNDDATPIDWVSWLLTDIFYLSEEESEDLAYLVSIEGSGTIGIYTFEIAEQKVTEAIMMCRDNGSNLEFKVEKE